MRKIVSMMLIMVLMMSLAVGCGPKPTAVENPGGQENGADTKPQETYTWRFAHEEIDGSVQDLYVKKFKEIIEKKSDGRINIEIYPVGQIGDATQQCELLQNGGIEFGIVSPGNTGTIVPENQLFSLHFLFTDDMDKNAEIFKTSKALNEMLSNKYLEKNIKVLAYWTEGAMQWTSGKPVNTPAQWKGFKMRTMPSPMIVAAYEAYGANPTPVPYMEVYSGLQLNMIEGQENPLFAIEEMKFYEVQKNLTLANSNLYVTTTAVNPDFFNSLPKDIQDMILETVDEIRDYSFEIQADLNGKALDKIKEKSEISIVELTAEEREAFREASKTAYDKYVKMVGPHSKEILDTLIAEVKAIESK
ncbi:tripartite ATP-independent transporter DctP family solute receptor [Anaerosolibacter carboniphilus]|uniref:Tripartite ATP-independent transporter DctP family solute receptor n=1 Tax=Anaerosolibacter carboniphilus TaxID=1417629 RepID=A0A841KPW6_9FIRM|nr:DctP family TRAP transporter solute-binding subunit [Anaerosolibacter carboniphilus]MBB6214140.1 tripartite ATP-independent transporter DctP family solute receptor [Anaerosolibacter carboniphilus]